MVSIEDLVLIQNPAERLAFKRHLEKRNTRLDTRNTALFEAFLNGEQDGIKKEIGDNAYRALKKRLTDQFIDFLANGLLRNQLSLENQVIKLIVVARKLFDAGRAEAGFDLLNRAESKALDLDHYTLLNEIYHSMVAHSHKTSKVDQQKLFQKLENNNANFIAQERLSISYASMQRQFNSESFRAVPPTFHKVYEDNCALFGLKNEFLNNFINLNQLCILADLYGSQSKGYHELDLFFEDAIAELQGSAKDSEKVLSYHIELLYGMANIYFRKYDFAKSVAYLKKMHVQMLRFDAKLFQQWNARYVNLLALNLNFTLKFEDATALLNQKLTINYLQESETALLKLSLAMIQFQQENLQEVKTILASLRRTDGWYLKQMGNEWLFNLRAIEVLLHFDLGNDDLAESRIKSFERKYGVHFKNDKTNPIWPFIGLVKSLLYNREALFTKEFGDKLEKSIPWKYEKEDLFNVCFYAWLKARMQEQSIYKTTLEIFNLKN